MHWWVIENRLECRWKHTHTHLIQSCMRVLQQSLAQSLGCLEAPLLSLITQRLAEQHCLPVVTESKHTH